MHNFRKMKLPRMSQNSNLTGEYFSKRGIGRSPIQSRKERWPKHGNQWHMNPFYINRYLINQMKSSFFPALKLTSYLLPPIQCTS